MFHLKISSLSKGSTVRFGSAEIYQVLESCFGGQQNLDPEMTVVDSVVVGQTILGGSDERVILFVKLGGGVRLGDKLIKAIAQEIRARRSARHVPAKVSWALAGVLRTSALHGGGRLLNTFEMACSACRCRTCRIR